MAETTVDAILNFIIPIGVWIFLGWILYRIPIVTELVHKVRDWMERRKNRETEPQDPMFYNQITYE